MWHPHVKAVQSSFRSTGHNSDSLCELRIYGHVYIHVHFLLLWSSSVFAGPLTSVHVLQDVKKLSSEKKGFYDQNIFWTLLDETKLNSSLYHRTSQCL